MPDLRCSLCHSEFEEGELNEDVVCCPSCATEIPPQSVDCDVALVLNWLDLRCLAQWASNYIESVSVDADVDQYLARLCDRIRASQPDGAPPLTLQDEVDEARGQGHEVMVSFVNPAEVDDDECSPAYPLM